MLIQSYGATKHKSSIWRSPFLACFVSSYLPPWLFRELQLKPGIVPTLGLGLHSSVKSWIGLFFICILLSFSYKILCSSRDIMLQLEEESRLENARNKLEISCGYWRANSFSSICATNSRSFSKNSRKRRMVPELLCREKSQPKTNQQSSVFGAVN